VLFALSMVPVVFLSGMALDYSAATQKLQRLNAAADAAALAAVSPAMMAMTTSDAQTAAANLFTGQASAITGATASAPVVTITQSGLTRTATVTFTASSPNTFASVLGKNSWPLSGTATATSAATANIDFYMMLDNSPSMTIAATTAGINTMMDNTPQEGSGVGCAFACHQSSPNSTDNTGLPSGWDNARLAQSVGVTTRIQVMASATQTLTATASSLASQTSAAFRMGVYTFSSSNSGSALTTVQSRTSNLTLAGTAAAGVDALEVCAENYINCANPPDGDTDTDFASALTSMNSIMSTPGTGASGSSPQAILFIVTDGVEDKKATSCPYPLNVWPDFSRCIAPFDITTCQTIKNRGIQIAILYTEYYPLTNFFYQQYVAPFQSSIGTNLQSCASAGLFYAVTPNGDITSSLTTLFNSAVQSVGPHLTN
jgi:hypothetical protein